MKRLLAALAFLAVASAMSQERMIFKEAMVEAPVAAVWQAWTTREGVESFFAPEAVIEPRPGGTYSIHINPYAAPGLRGADDMRVLGVQEDRMISFTWNAPPHLPEARAQRTVVIVRTEAAGDKRARVTIAHVGWGTGGEWEEAFKYFDNAWGRVLASLQKRFVDGPADWKSHLERMKQAW